MRKSLQPPPIERDTLLVQFATSLAKADLSPRTVAAYKAELDLFLRWLQKAAPSRPLLPGLSSFDLSAYRHHLLQIERLKAATINRRLQALRRFCRWATRQGLLTEDPSTEIQTIRIESRRQPQGLHDPEVHALLRAAGQSGRGLARRNYALVQLILQTGLRVSEVAALRRADVVLHDRSGLVRVRQGKGRREREVPLNSTARRALALYLKSRESVKPDSPLFESERQEAMSIRSFQEVVSELARRANIRRVRVSPHTFRHTFALGYLRHNPGKLVELATLLGHESLDTTAIYTRPSLEDLAADLERSPLNVDG